MEKFVSVSMSNCDEEPVISVVKEVTRDYFKIHCWKKIYRGRWSPLEPWTQIHQKGFLHSFELTEAKKLQTTTRKHLMEKYRSLRNVADSSI